MQTVTESQQGHDKKGCHGTWGGGEEDAAAQRLKGRKSTESNGDQRLRLWAQRINKEEREGLWDSLCEGTLRSERMTSIQDVGQLCVSVCACHFLCFFFSFKYVKEKEKEVKVVKEMEQLNLRNQGDKGGIFFPPSRTLDQ